MKINEIKRTVEEVVRTEYIANDGTVFCDRDECLKYERSALGVVRAKLKPMTKKNTRRYELFDEADSDAPLEIFAIESQEDLDNINQYLRLKSYEEPNILTEEFIGKEAILFWAWDDGYVCPYTLESLLDSIRHNFERITKPKEETK